MSEHLIDEKPQMLQRADLKHCPFCGEAKARKEVAALWNRRPKPGLGEYLDERGIAEVPAHLRSAI